MKLHEVMWSVSNFKNLASVNAHSHALESYVLYVIYIREQQIEWIKLQLMTNKLRFLTL